MKSNLSTKISSFLASLFGQPNWISPPWLQKAKSKPILSSLISLFLIASVAIFYWYQHLPKPLLIETSIQTPKLTPLSEEDELVPDSVKIDFGIKKEGAFLPQAVAPLNLVGQIVPAGINITPQLAGEFFWESDSRLVFTPNKDWQPDTNYHIQLSKDSVKNPSQLESLSFHFTTLPLIADIKEFKFYQDPLNPQIKQAIATVVFDYPINPASLEESISLTLEGNSKLNLEPEKYQFKVSYDKHKRQAFIQSEPIPLPNQSRFLVLNIDKGIQSTTGIAQTKKTLNKNVLIPDASNYFKIDKLSASIIRNEQDRPEQILSIETTLGATEKEIDKALHVYLLPQNYPAIGDKPEKQNYEWLEPGEINSSILALAKELPLTALPTDRNYANLHSYQFKADYPRFLYIKIDKGAKAFGDFSLKNDYAALIKVPELPKEISFLHKGALLALNGEQKLSVLVRGLPAVRFSIARVLTDNVNQLVSQTDGNFSDPYFINQSFNQQNISEIFSEIQPFDNSDPSKLQYTNVDFAKYLANNSKGMKGLFVLQAEGYDPEKKEILDVKTKRLILVTNLGMVVKDNNDGSHDVFVESIVEGQPSKDVKISILGKNGLSLMEQTSDENGHVHFPNLSDYTEDKEPTVYLASLNDDVSFIPYNKPDRQLNFSRFDVGGIYANNSSLQNLTAYLFSDRGIYRPGDKAHIGIIVKYPFANQQPKGLPLQLIITDPHGTTIKDEKLVLDETGLLSADFDTSLTSPTGQYYANLYVVKDEHPESYLGSTIIKLSEFEPDRLRIKASFAENQNEAWLSPDKIAAEVNLWNLYGSPASNRKISAKITLSPQAIRFDSYPDFIFADPFLDPKKSAKVFSEELQATTTDDKGQAEFNLDLKQFGKSTYRLSFFAEGFEAEGGRSVSTETSTLVSPLSYFIGYKKDGELRYIKQNSQREIEFIAINKDLKQQDISDLKLQLISLKPQTTLVKKQDGTYQYQSIIQEKILETKPFAIQTENTKYSLPTGQIGDFRIVVLDKEQSILNQFEFSIVGESAEPLAKNAELRIKLDKEEYEASSEIELEITAPYTGTGLITIERDKVYQTQWFKADTNSSIQKIRIPDNFEGNGYVNVTFVRNWDSPDIFLSPLSYSIAPFSVTHANKEIEINLSSPQQAKPGNTLTIGYKTNKPSKIIIFAVDEGILQVARFNTPDPLAYFFQKYALQVITQQTLDQILPKFIQERELSAVGGDDSEDLLAHHLNPFKRKTDLPVAFWSGILESNGEEQQLTYQIPDYFNGSLRIMAVAVSNTALGSTEKDVKVKGDFVINPNVPTFVAPNDEFEISASIANNVKDSGSGNIEVQLIPSANIELISTPHQDIQIDENKEKAVVFKLKAKDLLGPAKLSFLVHMGDKKAKMDSTLSVRPATAYTKELTTGYSKESSKTLDLITSFYSEHRQIEALASTSPLVLLVGLKHYMDGYPYGCTEQLTSGALPLLAMSKQSSFDMDKTAIHNKINATIQMISSRQMSNGAFSYWPGLGDNENNNFVSIYALHFLTEAKANNYVVPTEVMNSGLNFLRELLSHNPSDIEEARLQAYAIYVLTRNEFVTTNYLTNLESYLENDKQNQWQNNLIGAYIAATYKLLKNEDAADSLIRQFKIENNSQFLTNDDFYNQNLANAQYFYLVAKHFKDYLPHVDNQLINTLAKAMNSNEINTLLSGMISLAFDAYAEDKIQTSFGNLALSEILENNKEIKLSTANANYLKASLSNQAKKVNFSNPDNATFFYQLMQEGFNQNLPKEAIKNSIEIYREYRDLSNEVVDKANLGEELEVHIKIRSIDEDYLSNIVITDLIPGGFEIVNGSLKQDNIDYADLREDRANIFCSIDKNMKEIIYRIKATNQGNFALPAILAQSMYNPQLKAQGTSGRIIITEN